MKLFAAWFTKLTEAVPWLKGPDIHCGAGLLVAVLILSAFGILHSMSNDAPSVAIAQTTGP